MKKLIAALSLCIASAISAQESFLQVPPDSFGKKLRTRSATIGANTVHSQGFFIDDGSGSAPLGLSASPLFVNFVAGATAAVTQSGAWSVSVSNFPATQPISGSVSVSNFPATQPVSGTVAVSNFPATQPVSGSVTVSGSVSVSNLPATQTVAGTVTANAGAGPYPVSDNGGSLTVDGSVTTVQSSGANLHVNVDNTVTATANQGAAAATTSSWPTKWGEVAATTAAWTSATALNTAISADVSGYSTVLVSGFPTGTVGSGNATPEVSEDNANWFTTYCTAFSGAPGANIGTLALIGANAEVCQAWGKYFRLRLSTVTSNTGTANVQFRPVAQPHDNAVFVTGTAGTVTTSAQEGANFGSAAAGRGVQMGVFAIASGTDPTAATAGNIVRAGADLAGNQYVINGGPHLWHCALKGIAATLTQCIAAAATGYRHYVTDITVVTTTATSGTYAIQTGTGTNCGTGTAALWPSTATADRWNAPVLGAPQSMSLTTPLVPPAAAALCVIGVATNTITIDIGGYDAP